MFGNDCEYCLCVIVIVTINGWTEETTICHLYFLGNVAQPKDENKSEEDDVPCKKMRLNEEPSQLRINLRYRQNRYTNKRRNAQYKL